ncbi:MAG: arginine N-succinyltransferase [Tepidisphaeraceae bacterium]
MVFIRPVNISDLDQLEELAGLAGAGLTTLPKDRDLLSRRIAKSTRSFENLPDRPGGESYLFVMEDPDANRIVGACGIVSKVGGFQPFYAYKIETSLFESHVIKVRKEVPILTLYEEHDGPCEIGSLFLHPVWRKENNGRMLQLVRFLFIAEHPEAFEPTVVSEIRGVLDEKGHSPFWNALGQHFFDIDFTEADRLSIVNKRFIADLMPDHPIYIPLLPADAQDVIGKPHPESIPAVKNLSAEGFQFSGMVDIFDAGPVMNCPRDEIRTVRESRRGRVVSISDQPFEALVYMMGTTTGDFRSCKGPVQVKGDELVIPSDCAKVLKVRVGDSLRFVVLRAVQNNPPAP